MEINPKGSFLQHIAQNFIYNYLPSEYRSKIRLSRVYFPFLGVSIQVKNQPFGRLDKI